MLRKVAIAYLCSNFFNCGAATAEPIAALSKETNVTVVTDVDLSEWSPSMVLTFQTKSGEYSVEPPPEAWTGPARLPAAGRGVLTPVKRERVQQAVWKVIETWKDGHGRGARQGCQLPTSNSAPVRLRISWGTHNLLNTNCWTPAEFELRHILDEYFDYKLP